MLQKTQNVYIYKSLDTDKHCDLLHDRPVLSIGKTPHNRLHYNKIWS
jgi:hypothetical protein